MFRKVFILLLALLSLPWGMEAQERRGGGYPYPSRRYFSRNSGRSGRPSRPYASSAAESVSSKNLTKQRFNGQTGSLPYCQFTENMDSSDSPMLLLVLHGRSNSGTDNSAQLSSPALRSLLAYLGKRSAKMIIIAPQCPSGQDWTGGRGGRSLLPVLDELVRAKCREFNIQQQRCFITGISMGGGACYTLMAEYPGLFAKAIVVCAACRDADIARLRGDFFIIHGENDRLIPADRAKQTAQSISGKSNATAKLSILPGKDHISCAENAYGENCWSWLLR